MYHHTYQCSSTTSSTAPGNSIGFAPFSGRSRTDAAPSASSKVSSPADADGKDGTGSSSSASHSHGSASATALLRQMEGGSASAAAVTAKRSGNNKERARVVRRTCHALVSLIQDLGATHNPTIHNDSQTMGNALLECHSTLVYHLQKSRLVVNRHDSDPLMSKGTAENAGTGGRGGSKDSLNNKRRCQELIRNPTEFCRNQEGLVVQGDKLLNNYKGMDFTLAMWVMPTMRSSSRYCFISGKISHNDAWPLISMRNDGKIVIIYGHGNEFERATSQATIPVRLLDTFVCGCGTKEDKIVCQWRCGYTGGNQRQWPCHTLSSSSGDLSGWPTFQGRPYSGRFRWYACSIQVLHACAVSNPRKSDLRPRPSRRFRCQTTVGVEATSLMSPVAALVWRTCPSRNPSAPRGISPFGIYLTMDTVCVGQHW